MQKIKINLDDYLAIEKFVKTANTFVSDINISNNRAERDGKSLLAVMSLDISEGVWVWINTDNVEEHDKFNIAMKEFMKEGDNG